MARRSLRFTDAPGQKSWSGTFDNLRGRAFSAQLIRSGFPENVLGGFGIGLAGLCFLFALVASGVAVFRRLH